MTRVTTTLRMIVYLDCNGYCIDSDVWVTDKEREELIKKEKERQKKREETHGPSKNMYLDFSKLI